jgi:hypothetical protein
LWCIYPLLGNGYVNTFPWHKHSTIGHPLLGNGLVDVCSGQQSRQLPRVASASIFMALLMLKLRVGTSSVSEEADPSTMSSYWFSAIR